MFISHPKLLDILLKLVYRRMWGDLDNMSIVHTVKKVRVSSVGHCLVDEAVHRVDVHEDVLGRLSDEVDVPPIKSALVEEDDIKVFVLLQVSVGRGKAASFRTARSVERLTAKAKPILLVSIGLVPEEDVF